MKRKISNLHQPVFREGNLNLLFEERFTIGDVLKCYFLVEKPAGEALHKFYGRLK